MEKIIAYCSLCSGPVAIYSSGPSCMNCGAKPKLKTMDMDENTQFNEYKTSPQLLNESPDDDTE